MSVESAKAFIQKVKTDEEFKKKSSQFTDGAERLKFAKAEGFEFTPEEVAKVKEEQGLSDEELEGVAGGCGHGCLTNIGDIQVW